MPRLLIVIGSTRPGRIGRPVADWFIEHAVVHGGHARGTVAKTTELSRRIERVREAVRDDLALAASLRALADAAVRLAEDFEGRGGAPEGEDGFAQPPGVIIQTAG